MNPAILNQGRVKHSDAKPIEGVEEALCTASGMAAAAAIFMTFLSSGDHVIVQAHIQQPVFVHFCALFDRFA